MLNPRRLLLFTLMLAPLTGCSDPGFATTHRPLTGVESSHEQASDQYTQRLILNEGYSLLYTDAGLLNLAGLLLHAKAESKAVNEIISTVAAFGDELQQDLERIAQDYPAVRIDLDPLPAMEKRKRRTLTIDRVRYFAPIIGRGGREYERTLLISIANGINHQSYLCQVMAEEEPDASLKIFLSDTAQRYGDLYNHTNALLNREYFDDPHGKTKH